MSFDFWDDGAEEMIEEQKKEASASTSDSFFPVTYTTGVGSYIFRIYPEKYKGKPRMRRVVWTNSLHNYKRVLSTKEDKRIDDLIKKAIDDGFNNKATGFWKHKRKLEAIMMVELFSAPEGKYIKKGTTCMILDSQKLQGLDTFLDSLEEEGVSLMSFLNPNKPNNAIKMTVSEVMNGKKKEYKFNFSTTASSEYELNKTIEEGLPGDFKFEGLDETYVKEGTFLTDEEFVEFEEYAAKKLKELNDYKASYAKDSSESHAGSGYQVSFDDEKEEEVESAGK